MSNPSQTVSAPPSSLSKPADGPDTARETDGATRPSRSFRRTSGDEVWFQDETAETFAIRTDWGNELAPEGGVFRHRLLTVNECEDKLKSVSSRVEREGESGVKGWDVASLAVNTPNEDAQMVDVISLSALRHFTASGDHAKPMPLHKMWAAARNATLADSKDISGAEDKAGTDKEGELVMITVVDGHGTSDAVPRLLEKVLHPALARTLAAVYEDGSMQDEDTVCEAISDAFAKLDRDVLEAAASQLEPNQAGQSLAMAALTALEGSGACVTSTIIDTANGKLYTAHLGDCRAVAGWRHPDTGAWRCEVLSVRGDQDADNPLEVADVRAAHPDENPISNANGPARLVGYTITRAIGDAYGKRSLDELKRMKELHGVKYPVGRDGFNNEPYIGSRPEVISRDLRPPSGEVLDFIVTASDGLWDNMSSEEAGLLVAAQRSGLGEKVVEKADLSRLVDFETQEPRPYPAEPLPGTTHDNSEGTWELGDDNLATMLVRNGLGRGDPWMRQRLTSVSKEGGARFVRDDTTVV